jgi:hypothetical protein
MIFTSGGNDAGHVRRSGRGGEANASRPGMIRKD